MALHIEPHGSSHAAHRKKKYWVTTYSAWRRCGPQTQSLGCRRPLRLDCQTKSACARRQEELRLGAAQASEADGRRSPPGSGAAGLLEEADALRVADDLAQRPHNVQRHVSRRLGTVVAGPAGLQTSRLALAALGG